MKNDLNVNPKRGTDGMNPQKENCWMKDYEHRVFAIRPDPLSAPQEFTHSAGAILKGLAQNSLQSSQFCKQTGPQVLILHNSANKRALRY